MQLKDFMPDTLTPAHYAAYGEALGNWTYCSYFLANGATPTDIGIMLRMEIEGKQRPFMIERLIGKLMTIYRNEFRSEVEQIMNERRN